MIILVLGLVGGIIGFTFASMSPPKFRSSSSVIVTAGVGSTASELVQGSTFIEKLVANYALLARSEIVLQPVIEDLELDTTVNSLAGSVTATSTLNTVIIDVSGVGATPSAAKELAASVTENLIRAVREISPKDSADRPTVRMTTIEFANLPGAPFEPNKRLAALSGVLLGLAIGIVYAVLRRTFAETVTSAAELSGISEVLVLGEVPDARRQNSTVAALLTDPLSIDAEALRALSANLSFIGVDGGLRSLVVSSGSMGEGKTTTAVALALTLAEIDSRVLLIDADLRHPSVADTAGIDGSVGLTSVLIGSASLADAVVEWGLPGLSVLPSGPHAPNPAQLLRSDAMAGLVAAAHRDYDVVVIDSAPVLAVTDALWLGHMVDGVLLVAAHRRTHVRSLQRTLLALADANVVVLGVVLSRVPRRSRAAYGVDASTRKSARGSAPYFRRSQRRRFAN